MALSGHQPRGNGAPQRRARKSPRAASPSIGPFWPPVPGKAALLKGGRAKVRAQPLLSIGPFWPPVPGERRSSKEGARKSARNLSFNWPFAATSPGGTALLKGGRAKVRAQPLLSIGPSWPPVLAERRSSKEGAQKSARALFFPLPLADRQFRGNGSSKEGAQKSARSLFFPLALPRRQSRGNGAPQRRARKSPRAAFSFHWPFLAASHRGTALLKGGRAKVRAQPLLSIGLSWPPVPGERRSSKEGAQKSARSLFLPLALPGHQSRGKRLLKGGRAKVRAQPLLSTGPCWPPIPRGNGAPQRRARKSPRAASPFHWPFLATSPGGTALLKAGRAKVRAQPFLPWALPGPQSRGNGAPQRRARKSPRAAFSSIAPSWPPVPGERRSSKEGAQKSARSLFFPLALPGHQPWGNAPKRRARKSPRAPSFLPLALPGRQSRGNGAPQRRARKSPRAASSFHWPFLATSPGGTALLKGGRAKVRAQPFLPLTLPGRQSRGNGAPQRRARKSPRAASSFHWPFLATSPGGTSKEGAQKSARNLSFQWPFLATSPGGTALFKGGRAKVRAQLFLPLTLPGRQSRGNGAPQRRARKSPRARSSFHCRLLTARPRGNASSKEGAQKSARSLFFPLALPGRQSRGNGAPQRRARKSPRAASSFHWPFLAASFGGTALLKGGRAKVRAQPLPSIGPSWPPVLGERRSSKRARKSPRAASPFHWPFLATSSGGTALLKGGRAKVRARALLSTAAC